MEDCVSEIVVPCKEHLKALQERCEIHGIVINPASLLPPSPPRRNGSSRAHGGKTRAKQIYSQKAVKTARVDDEYEVERIVDLKIENDVEYYLVHWKGWDESFDTWEPVKNILNSPKLLEDFYLRSSRNGTLGKKLVILDEKYAEKMRHLQLLYPPDAKSGVIGKPNSGKHKTGNSYLDTVCKIRSSAAYHRLKEWEREINAVAPNEPPIIVENHVDLEGPPDNFTYISDYRAGVGVVIPQDPLVGCSCQSNCLSSKESCCGQQGGSQFAYSRYRRLAVLPGTPIYECNKHCLCGSDCPNRVVQLGRKVKLAIFRTADGRGWGVKALRNIPKNMFVMEYLGEVITSEEAERRGQQYDAEGRTYLFDLDFNGEDCPYTVDAALYGNVSHFMNHSCDPNLIVYGVWINTIDPALPRLAFFTKRDIKSGEELTFDYLMNVSKTSEEDQSPSTENSIASDDTNTKRMPCKCGAKNCRQFLN